MGQYWLDKASLEIDQIKSLENFYFNKLFYWLTEAFTVDNG